MAPTDAERMIELLQYANLQKVASALGVTRTTTSQWSRGLDVNPRRLAQVEQLLRPAAPQPEPPAWAVALTDEMAQQRLMLEQLAGKRTNETAAPAWWAEAAGELRREIARNRELITGRMDEVVEAPQEQLDEMLELLRSVGVLPVGPLQRPNVAGQAAGRRTPGSGAGRPRRAEGTKR